MAAQTTILRTIGQTKIISAALVGNDDEDNDEDNDDCDEDDNGEEERLIVQNERTMTRRFGL